MKYKRILTVSGALLAALAIQFGLSPKRALAQNPAVQSSEMHSAGSGGQAVPRFVSLKADLVNVRQGPSPDHAVRWVFRRAGLPVEVLAEFEAWRQVRDSEGATGWVLSSLLSSRRTSLVSPGKKNGEPVRLYGKASTSAPVLARLESGLLLSVRSCNGQWCRVTVNEADGWIDQNALWGVYPNEVIE